MVVTRRSVCALVFAMACDFGCSSTWPQVMDPSDIAGLREGSPRIRRVVDIGSPHIGKAGPLQPASDGNVTVGEQLLIEGSGFGKQPTVLIGGRPAELRWRTDGGGVIVQVPAGVPTGAQPLVVEAGGKRAEATVTLQRLAVILDGQHGRLQALRVSGGGGQPPAVEAFGKPVPVAGARGFAMSSDGAAVYVLVSRGERESVLVVDLTAAGGPSVRDERPLAYRAVAILAAASAPSLVIVGESELALWDVSEANRPTPWPAVALPSETRGATLFALDPTGKLLAAGFATTNEVALLDVRPGRSEVVLQEVARTVVLPLARQPLLHSLRFSMEGDLLWALSGEGRDASGQQATQLVAVSVGEKEPGGSKRTLGLGKPIEVRDAGPPLALSVARSRPVVSGATIRAVPERSLLVFATAPRSEGSRPQPGALFRVGGGGILKTVISGTQLFPSVDLSPDAGLAVAAEQPQSGPLTVTVADTEIKSTASLSFGSATADSAKSVGSPVSLWVQP